MVSWIRSCYRTLCRFYPDRPDVVIPIQWYFTNPKNGQLPFENVFTSRVWYDGSDAAWPLLGEVEGAPRQWVRGDAPEVMLPNSCQINGAAWTEGVPYALADSFPHTAGGVLLCCVGVIIVGLNSIDSSDGSLIFAPPTGPDVDGILNVAHSNVWVIVQSFQPASNADNAIVIQGVAGQVESPLVVVDDIGTKLWESTASGLLLLNRGLQVGDPTGLAPPLIVDALPAGQGFAIGIAGQVETSTLLGPGPIGDVKARLPLYDLAGVLQGYAPVYLDPSSPINLEDDLFTDVDHTTLDAHVVAPLNVMESLWCEETGQWEILTNTARVAVSSGVWDVALLDCGAKNGTILCSVVNAAAGYWGVPFRCSTGQSALYAFVTNVGGLFLYRREAGTFTALASTGYVPLAAPATMQVTFQGPDLVISIVGGPSLSYRTAAFINETAHGMLTLAGACSYSRWRFST